MTEQEIMDSSAFKVLNHMIDEKASRIINYLPWFKDEVNRLFSEDTEYKGYITTRTYEEGNTKINMPARLHDLRSLVTSLNRVIDHEEEIAELQRQKLRLLNDYDFTHGDDSEQKKIFG